MTLENLLAVIPKSRSVAQALRLLGLKPAGGNYKTFNKMVKENNLDTSHFSSKGWSKGQTFGPKTHLEKHLTKNSSIQSSKLRRRLIKEGHFEHKCQKCGLIEWLGYLIPLELHHINGDTSDNRVSNLQLLCPNCHTFTDNYRGKGIKSRKLGSALP